MSEKKIFDYFYGSQSEQFSFFRLPKVLIRDERFRKISSDAKILYVKVNIKMLKNRNIKMYRAPIFIPPAVLPKRIVFL